jgi:5-methyltetrahydropteroyltriglutamate--homocysteine methyltransferase
MPDSVRADNLGSFLRPAYLHEARAADLPADELRATEDRAIEEIIKFQEDVGLPVVSDGEFRRRFFFSTIEFLVDGIDPYGYVRHHQDEDGVQHELRTPTPKERLTRRTTLADYEATFARQHTDRLLKVTMPTPSLLGLYWKDGVSAGYSGRDEYVEHLVEIMREDVDALVAAGVDQIQLDVPHYAYIQKVMPDVSDREATLRRIIEIDNKLFDNVDGRVTKAMHICRGNDRSHFTGTEAYDGFAASIFPYTAATRLLLEYDDERSGGFTPLQHVRDDQEVVLGLVTTKRPDMESSDELKARIDDAAHYVPLERLALSTQCGFASNVEGNAIDADSQRAKMELVVQTATDVWGHA